MREGGFIRPGFNAEVDRLHDILKGGKGTIAGIEGREKEKTGIRTLKIKYNRVFGYYIEVSNSFKDLVPDYYIRKQTLANSERYVTEELKELENTILTASDRVGALEYELFSALRRKLPTPRRASRKQRPRSPSWIPAPPWPPWPCATITSAPRWTRAGVIEIHDGRHPVVEKVLRDAPFVPNDTFMGEKEERIAIITGPNIGRKIHLYAPGGADRAPGPDRLLRAGKGRPHRRLWTASSPASAPATICPAASPPLWWRCARWRTFCIRPRPGPC